MVDLGMTRAEAEALAARIGPETGVRVLVVEDGEWFALSVQKPHGNALETFTIYDEHDWDWLAHQILS